MGIQDLLAAISGVDTEHEAIIAAVTAETHKRLSAISGDNKLARAYVQQLWSDCMKALQEADISVEAEELPNILRVIADTYELRTKLHKDLHDRRDAELAMRVANADKNGMH